MRPQFLRRNSPTSRARSRSSAAIRPLASTRPDDQTHRGPNPGHPAGGRHATVPPVDPSRISKNYRRHHTRNSGVLDPERTSMRAGSREGDLSSKRRENNHRQRSRPAAEKRPPSPIPTDRTLGSPDPSGATRDRTGFPNLAKPAPSSPLSSRAGSDRSAPHIGRWFRAARSR